MRIDATGIAPLPKKGEGDLNELFIPVKPTTAVLVPWCVAFHATKYALHAGTNCKQVMCMVVAAFRCTESGLPKKSA